MLPLPQAIPAVWVYTTGATFNAPRIGGYGAFLSRDEQARLERLRQGRMLFGGLHREYFLDEQRTQFDFPAVRAGDRTLRMYLTYNVLGLISLKSADLLFGESPLLRVDDAAQQERLSALVDRCNLHALLHSSAVNASYQGECFLESCVHEGEVYLQELPADEMFPAGDLGPDGQYDVYRRRRIQNVGTAARPTWLLLEETYAAGSIERHVYVIEDAGPASADAAPVNNRREVPLESWPIPADAAALVSLTRTGIDDCTITWVPNLLVRGQPVSDYDGAIDLQDALNAKVSQVGRVLLKHSDPKMVFPAESQDETGNVRQDYDAFFFTDPNQIPKYVTWNAELDAAMRDRAFALNQLLVRTETSPVLLGLKEGAAPDAYKKVRLESFNSLTKAARKAAYWKAGLRRAIAVAQDLENTLPGLTYSVQPVGVELRDGIPVDDVDLANKQSILIAAGAMSIEGAVEERLIDPAAIQKELGRITADKAAATPSILLQPPAGGQEQGPTPGTEPTPQRLLPGARAEGPPESPAAGNQLLEVAA